MPASAFAHAATAFCVYPMPGALACASHSPVMRASHDAPRIVATRCPHAFAFAQYALA